MELLLFGVFISELEKMLKSWMRELAGNNNKKKIIIAQDRKDEALTVITAYIPHATD